jgi:hypothetical protein
VLAKQIKTVYLEGEDTTLKRELLNTIIRKIPLYAEN